MLPATKITLYASGEIGRREQAYHRRVLTLQHFPGLVKDLWDFSHDIPLTAWNVAPRRNEGRLLAPGQPEESAMYQLLAAGMMPPIGVQVRDDETVRDMNDWISSLKGLP